MKKANNIDSELGIAQPRLEEYENLFGIKLKGLFGKGKKSANQMYDTEMEERKKVGKEKVSFKEWLERAQQFGLVDKIMGKDPTITPEPEDETPAGNDSKDKDLDKPNKILGLPPMVVYIGGVAAAGFAIWGIVAIVKAIRKGKS